MPKDDDDFDEFGDSGEDIEDDPEVAAYFESVAEGQLDLVEMPPHIAGKVFGGEIPGVRCPKCEWRPRSKMKWGCNCGYVWNTFGTRGKCPKCAHQWADTQCMGCHQWSPHEEWYEAVGLPS